MDSQKEEVKQRKSESNYEEQHDEGESNQRNSQVTAWEKFTNSLLIRLFFKYKFLNHRLIGLAYLIQWVVAFYYYFFDNQQYRKSPLWFTLPLNGWLQSLSAAYTFRFLPKQKDPGYYGDKSVLSYNFVLENGYFSLLIFITSGYMNSGVRSWFGQYPIVEAAVILLPFQVIRPFFPTTRLRDSLQVDKNKTDQNKGFFVKGTWVTKVFFLWAKHFNGIFLRYLQFLGVLSYDESVIVQGLLISSGFAVTISIFLHTLKFKKMMEPKLSFGIYILSYLTTLYSFWQFKHLLVDRWDITLICAIGLYVDLKGRTLKYVWAILIAALLFARRYELVNFPQFPSFSLASSTISF